MKRTTVLAPRHDPAGALPKGGTTPGGKLKLAMGTAVRRARRMARSVTTRVEDRRAEAHDATDRVRAGTLSANHISFIEWAQ